MKAITNLSKYKMIKVFTMMALFLFALGCSDKKNENETLTSDDNIETNTEVADASEAVQENNTMETNNDRVETRKVYYPDRSQSNDNKVTINTTSLQFKGLDKDNNGIVNKEELYDGLFSLLDSDGNSFVTDEEFRNSKQEFFSKNPSGRYSSFSNWDSNKDQSLTRDEFVEKFSSIIDVADDETLAQNTYIVWDQDNDEKIERLELDNVIIRFDKNDN